MKIDLETFLEKANLLVDNLKYDHRFLMVDHDFNINVNRAFDDAQLLNYLNIRVPLTTSSQHNIKVTRSAQYCIA